MTGTLLDYDPLIMPNRIYIKVPTELVPLGYPTTPNITYFVANDANISFTHDQLLQASTKCWKLDECNENSIYIIFDKEDQQFTGRFIRITDTLAKQLSLISLKAFAL